jgi:hypothetical protein
VHGGVVEAAGQAVGARGLSQAGVGAGVPARRRRELAKGLEQTEVVGRDVVRSLVAPPPARRGAPPAQCIGTAMQLRTSPNSAGSA